MGLALPESGELILEGSATEDIVCGLIFDQAWEGALEDRYFDRAVSTLPR